MAYVPKQVLTPCMEEDQDISLNLSHRISGPNTLRSFDSILHHFKIRKIESQVTSEVSVQQ